jgi:hypothetical protein
MSRFPVLVFLFLAMLASVAFAPAAWSVPICHPDSLFTFPALGYLAGPNPHDAVIADFDGDGIPDVAVVNSAAETPGPGAPLANTVEVRLGTGAGYFGVEAHYATEGRPYGLATADLNGDGIPDLVVACNTSNTVDVFLGNGDGTFSAFSSFPAGSTPYRVVAGDLNGDGRLDLVVLANTYSGPGLNVLLATPSPPGTVAYAAPVFIPLSNAPAGLAIGDFNKDGILDLAATIYNGGFLAVLIGKGSGGVGTGTFAAPVYYPTSDGAFDVHAADLNKDGILDLVTCGNANGVTVHLGNGSGGIGDGTFAPGVNVGGGNLSDIEIGDFDGDGNLDIAASGGPRNSVYTFRGNGNGTFLPPAAHAVGSFCIGLASGDLDGDGKPDLVSVAYHGSGFNTLLTGCTPFADGSPLLDFVKDVPNDQGGRVFVVWRASLFDGIAGSSVTSYRVWRRVPTLAPSLVSQAAALDTRGTPVGRSVSLATARALTRTDGGNVTYWEALTTLPSQRLSAYGYTAATTQDSLIGNNPFTAFFVSALTSDPNIFYSSNVDSGYSVDNLPPHEPFGFSLFPASSGGATVKWLANEEPDLKTYRLYRGNTEDFVPGPGNLLADQSATTYNDPYALPGMYFKLDAVDVHDNHSDFAVAQLGSLVGANGKVVLALAGPWPNPSRSGVFDISVSHPYPGRVLFEVFDVRGTRVFSRQLEGTKPGTDTFTAGASKALGAGLYLVRVTNGPETREVKTMVLP